jgi:xanthosine utilization system XapX-like protein
VITVVVGLLLGFILGLLVGPMVRSLLSWREYAHASREARLAEDLIRHMSDSAARDEVEEERAVAGSR